MSNVGKRAPLSPLKGVNSDATPGSPKLVEKVTMRKGSPNKLKETVTMTSNKTEEEGDKVPKSWQFKLPAEFKLDMTSGKTSPEKDLDATTKTSPTKSVLSRRITSSLKLHRKLGGMVFHGRRVNAARFLTWAVRDAVPDISAGRLHAAVAGAVSRRGMQESSISKVAHLYSRQRHRSSKKRCKEAKNKLKSTKVVAPEQSSDKPMDPLDAHFEAWLASQKLPEEPVEEAVEEAEEDAEHEAELLVVQLCEARAIAAEARAMVRASEAQVEAELAREAAELAESRVKQRQQQRAQAEQTQKTTERVTDARVRMLRAHHNIEGAPVTPTKGEACQQDVDRNIETSKARMATAHNNIAQMPSSPSPVKKGPKSEAKEEVIAEGHVQMQSSTKPAPRSKVDLLDEYLKDTKAWLDTMPSLQGLEHCQRRAAEGEAVEFFRGRSGAGGQEWATSSSSGEEAPRYTAAPPSTSREHAFTDTPMPEKARFGPGPSPFGNMPFHHMENHMPPREHMTPIMRHPGFPHHVLSRPISHHRVHRVPYHSPHMVKFPPPQHFF